MKKIFFDALFFLVLLIFGNPFPAKCQGKFEVILPQNGSAYARQNPSGNYDVALEADSMIVILDSAGQIFASRNYSIGISNFKVDSAARIWCGGRVHNGFVFDAATCLIDGNLDTIWTRKFPTTYAGSTIIDVELDTTGNFYFAFLDNVPGVSNYYSIFALDQSGDSLLNFRCSAITDFIITEDSKIVRLETNIDLQQISIIKSDLQGNLIWRTDISDTNTVGGIDDFIAYAVGEATDGTFIVGGGHQIQPGYFYQYAIRIDGVSGDTLYTRTFNKGYFTTMIPTSDGGFAATSEMELFRFDSALNVLWTRNYTGLGSAFAVSLQETSDHGFLIAGSTHDTTFTSNPYYPYVVKTDSVGNSLSTGLNSLNNSLAISVFPNPFTFSCRLQVPCFESELRLFDMTGKCMHMEVLTGNHPVFYRNNLPAGFYLLRLSCGEKLFLQTKLVIVD